MSAKIACRAGAALVVKLGGSLMHTPALGVWLDCLRGLSSHGMVIVPGGGVFADQVRASQRDIGFSDRTAHRMAVLGMEQYGLMLSELLPGARQAPSIETLRAACDGGRLAVWLPARMLAGRPDIKANWSVTADSLGLWLAMQLRAPRYALIKSVSLPEVDGQLWECHARCPDVPPDLLDGGFAALRREYAGSVHVFGDGHQDDFRRFVVAASRAGTQG